MLITLTELMKIVKRKRDLLSFSENMDLSKIMLKLILESFNGVRIIEHNHQIPIYEHSENPIIVEEINKELKYKLLIDISSSLPAVHLLTKTLTNQRESYLLHINGNRHYVLCYESLIRSAASPQITVLGFDKIIHEHKEAEFKYKGTGQAQLLFDPSKTSDIVFNVLKLKEEA